ncbi:MAG TPA: sensor domain-containing diguanylate cyclase [Chthoniobacterales bacterium]|nr:sensor domain-containing diguanylate cyclase [Chthoniobacterales bacterium]
MKAPDLPPNEEQRQKSLESLNILETAIEERFERVTRLASRLIGTPIATITMIDGDRQWFKSVQGLASTEGPRETSFCGHTILSDGPFVIEDATKDERFADNPLVTGDPNIRFYAGCPVHAPDGQRVGSLCVIDREPRKLTPSQMEDLIDLAAMVDVEIKSKQLAIAQMRMNEELAAAKRAVLVDPLTRLWNRAGGEEFLSRQHQVAVQKGEKFCIGMVDIDHFKKVNDTYGHAVGDEVLREVAKRILRSIRDEDFACRMGGEEFLIVIADPMASDALTVAGKVRETVRSAPVESGGQSVPVTLSIGLAYFDPAALVKPEEVIRLADESLYRAKETGRDRIISHIENGA